MIQFDDFDDHCTCINCGREWAGGYANVEQLCGACHCVTRVVTMTATTFKTQPKKENTSMNTCMMIVVYSDPKDGEDCDWTFTGQSRAEVENKALNFVDSVGKHRLIRLEFWELQDVGEPPKDVVWRGKP